MSVLFMMLASGWTLTFQEVSIDDGAEIYLPIGSLIVMLQILMTAFTFIDVDASHKYHDFSGF